MGERILNLNNAAQQGNIDAFYVLIGEDVKLLEDIDELPFVDTPLHIAASAGDTQHIQFAMEVMRLKPSFARKPNPNGYSPIHLALKEGHTRMVCRLLQVDGDLVRVKGREGRTPLHDVAATDEQLDLMDNLLSACPNSIEDVTIRNQTALHIALVENNNLKAFKRLVRWLRENKSENAREILNWQDEAGNTVLHVAVSRNQTEAVWELLNFGVNVNAKNLERRTARELLQDQGEVNNSDIRDMLNAGALSCSCSFLPIVNCYEYYVGKPKVLFYVRSLMLRNTVLFFGRLRVFSETAREASRISNDDRNALLVVAALLITITYQVVITPPGGLWQDTTYGDQSSSNAPALDGEVGHYAGTSIGQETFKKFGNVATLNYITFTLSTIMTFLLLPRGYISALFKMALVQLWVSYYYSLTVILESEKVFVSCLISTGLCLVLVLFAFYGRQLCGARIKCLRLDWIFYLVYACVMFLMILVIV